MRKTAARVVGCLAVAAALLGGRVVTSAAEKKLPPAEDLELDTADGVKMAATFYPGTNGRETVPVVLLHMWKRDRTDYKDLAQALQARGHAVLVPDLRGHGDTPAAASSTKSEKSDPARLQPKHFAAMVLDLDAVKNWLWKKNNEGALNLNKLCIVGAEMGASVGLLFAGHDWFPRGRDYPYLGVQQYQLGAFVKALVLLSPEKQFKGLDAVRTTKGLGSLCEKQLSVMIIVGAENKKLTAEANDLYDLLKPIHIDPKKEEKQEQKTLWLGELKTSLQGTRMLGVKELNVESNIAKFIDLRLVGSDAAKKLTWKELKNPYK
jgi:dienelactone hydrolase